ncbi:U6 snRNA phosphodiesterase 1-like [Ptychodera flava]|uniref:U6 snRNA phosphodiesterase 1-like n=1 Tax=Ptychodera flava TaxID=63121 RepID=UPI003969E9FF
MNALSNVQVYGSTSSSEDDSDDGQNTSIYAEKRKISLNSHDPPTKRRAMKSEKCPPLELPADILKMFSSTDDKSIEDGSTQHQGRIRSFPHEQGNWATFVYIPVDLGGQFHRLISSLLDCLPSNLEMQPVDDFHVSLSRTVVIRHHWINGLVESLRENIGGYHSFQIMFEKIEFYTNDEQTRSFLGLKTNSLGSESLLSLTSQIDSSLAEFKLPPFYKNPSFHMSIAWCLGDIRSKVNCDVQRSLQKTFDEVVFEDPALQKVDVKELRCKTGNKHFSFWLR